MKKILFSLLLALSLSSTVDAACVKSDLAGSWIFYKMSSNNLLPTRCYVTVNTLARAVTYCNIPDYTTPIARNMTFDITSTCIVTGVLGGDKINAILSRDKLQIAGLFTIPTLARGGLISGIKL